ncbi:MAG: hypothetical protein ACM3YE_09785 [Bacteroidota bacterium]
MAIRVDIEHDILLIITTVLFILFATGLAVPSEIPTTPIILPP